MFYSLKLAKLKDEACSCWFYITDALSWVHKRETEYMKPLYALK
jgi:hypothetical protein